MTKPPDREVLLEFQRVGSYMKATAMDAATLTEVSVVGPVNHSQEMLKRTVLGQAGIRSCQEDRNPAASLSGGRVSEHPEVHPMNSENFG